MTLEEIRTRLHAMAEPRMQAFCSSLLPGIRNILGVRIPRLRLLAQELAKNGDTTLLHTQEAPQSMEETMLRGMLPGYLPKNIGLEERLALLRAFVPTIDNWSVCDSCCATYKFVRADAERTWEFLSPYLSSEAEYEARFGIVMLINHFVKNEVWAEHVLEALHRVRATQYYATMAAGWCLCELYLQHRYLAHRTPAPHSTLRADIADVALRKIRESHRKFELPPTW